MVQIQAKEGSITECLAPLVSYYSMCPDASHTRDFAKPGTRNVAPVSSRGALLVAVGTLVLVIPSRFGAYVAV